MGKKHKKMSLATHFPKKKKGGGSIFLEYGSALIFLKCWLRLKEKKKQKTEKKKRFLTSQVAMLCGLSPGFNNKQPMCA